MIRSHNLLGKKYLCSLFISSATTPRERVNLWGVGTGSPGFQMTARHLAVNHPSPISRHLRLPCIQSTRHAVRAVFTLPHLLLTEQPA